MPRISRGLQDWIEARNRFHLSHAHVQMAREIGPNPKKLGKIDNHNQELWKVPLPQFIERVYQPDLKNRVKNKSGTEYSGIKKSLLLSRDSKESFPNEPASQRGLASERP